MHSISLLAFSFFFLIISKWMFQQKQDDVNGFVATSNVIFGWQMMFFDGEKPACIGDWYYVVCVPVLKNDRWFICDMTVLGSRLLINAQPEFYLRSLHECKTMVASRTCKRKKKVIPTEQR